MNKISLLFSGSVSAEVPLNSTFDLRDLSVEMTPAENFQVQPPSCLDFHGLWTPSSENFQNPNCRGCGFFSGTTQSTFKPFLNWNQRFWACLFHEIRTLFLSKWNGHSCRHALPWTPQSSLFAFQSRFLSFYIAWNQSLFLSKWNQHSCCHAYRKINIQIFHWAEIDIFELERCLK